MHENRIPSAVLNQSWRGVLEFNDKMHRRIESSMGTIRWVGRIYSWLQRDKVYGAVSSFVNNWQQLSWSRNLLHLWNLKVNQPVHWVYHWTLARNGRIQSWQLLSFNCTNFMLLSSKICFNVTVPSTPAFQIFSAPVLNVTRLVAGRTGVRIPVGGEFFISQKKVQTIHKAQQPSFQWVWRLFLGERTVGAWRWTPTSPCSGEVETKWS